MTIHIDRVAVIGAGTMGAAIAAHCANAGLPVLLLDIVPRELTAKEEKKGLTLEDRAVRNRIAADGLARIAKLKPASFMSKAARSLVEVGNLEDDLGRIAEVDWTVEAIVERLDIKRDLMARIDAVRRPGSLITTNTSGLPIHQIAEGRSEDFRRHFFGTHFFNPPRYMKLLEVIRGDEADADVVEGFADFARRQLGKGVVFCKDTPNFIGNRVLSVHGSFAIAYALDNGYRFEEADALTGPLIGRPKTATFRLQDLVGIDIASGVAQNLYDLIPDDPHREILKSESAARVIGGLVERGRLGNKTGSGFFRKGKAADGSRVFEVVDPESFEYEPQQKARFESVGQLRKVEALGERVGAFFSPELGDDRAAAFVRAVVSHLLSYSAYVAPEVAYALPSLDEAVRWGFSHEAGPFELWDAMGVAETAAAMEAAGFEVAPWVKEMLGAGAGSFYQRKNGRPVAAWDWTEKAYKALPQSDDEIFVADLRAASAPVESNDSASLHDLGEGVLLLEFHSKMNAIDDQTVAMMHRAVAHLDGDDWAGLVIGNDAANFCVGANLMGVGMLARQGQFDQIGEASKALQHALAALRRHRKPVVSAVHGMALGGGCEIALGADRIVAHAETYMGLVEVGVGLVPAGGGLMELVRRVVTPTVAYKEGDPLPAASKALESAAMAKVSTSAAEAGELGFLRDTDRVVMHRDHLLSQARHEVLDMVADGYRPSPEATDLYAGGRNLKAALDVGVWSLVQAGWASEHDALIAKRIGHILSGGDSSAPGRFSEEHFLHLEREAFVDLVKTEKTQQRIQHMLETGKPLR
ncbi:MAG: 3-hydroxyacyl-CoA dehydrogenase/enoyl-CoA hydratase family protein, partial [Acidobacteriota bacterium]